MALDQCKEEYSPAGADRRDVSSLGRWQVPGHGGRPSNRDRKAS